MNGFLPTRGSFMLDLVVVAMVAIMLALFYSIWLVRQKKRYQLHKRLQITMAVALLVTIILFELDVRFYTDWRELASASRFYQSGWVDGLLYIHLCFAIPAPFVWAFVVIRALQKFEKPPRPGSYSKAHRRWGWIAAIIMGLTALTGWVFYLAAFVF